MNKERKISIINNVFFFFFWPLTTLFFFLSPYDDLENFQIAWVKTKDQNESGLEIFSEKKKKEG